MILAASISPSLGWIIVSVLGLFWIALGVLWGRKAKTSEGFVLAGRNVGMAFGSATAMATWVTSNTTMLAPVFALTLGVWGMLAYSTASFGLLLFAPFAVRIHRLLPKGYTAGDFFRLRYGRTGWSLFLLITMVYSLSWLVSMAIAGGDLLQSLAGIPYLQGMSLILAVCVIYTLFGGLYAVIGTDFVQSLIILIGIVVIGGFVLAQLDFAHAYQHIATHQPSLISLVFPAALLAIFNNMLFGFGEVFPQQRLVVPCLRDAPGGRPKSLLPVRPALVSDPDRSRIHRPCRRPARHQYRRGQPDRPGRGIVQS